MCPLRQPSPPLRGHTMPTINKLTASQVRQAKPEAKPYKLHDGAGLSLRVRKSGREWLFRFKRDGKSRETVLGKFPELSLADARRRRDEARALLADGIDPIEHRREQREAIRREQERGARTIARVFDDWVAGQHWTEGYREKLTGRWRRYILPKLGERPIEKITAPEVLEALRVAERAGTMEVAPRCRQDLSRLFAFAIASGWATHDPAAGLAPALKKKPPAKHRAAILDPDRLGEALRAIDSHAGQGEVKAALQLLPMLMVRPGELRWMEWKELDLEVATWSIPAEKMKMRADHLVPLPRQALAILRELADLSGHRALAFPSLRDATKPFSENTMNAAFRRMGFSRDEVTAHGFRATARTLIAERLRWPAHVIELQLAHAPRDPLGRAYNRADFLEDRREMLQAWADYLDRLRTPDDD